MLMAAIAKAIESELCVESDRVKSYLMKLMICGADNFHIPIYLK